MAVSSLRILCRIDCPSTTLRLWDGSGGPFVDAAGAIWRPCVLTDAALDQIEAAINGEAVTISLTLAGVDATSAAAAWADYQSGEIVGSTIQVLIQDCDDLDQPIGSPSVEFTGTIDNIVFAEQASSDGITDTLTIEVTNRFTLRTLTNGGVLSDVEQRARSAVLNPGAAADRFCERIPGLIDKTVRWPDW
jgi:hypothetical protein